MSSFLTRRTDPVQTVAPIPNAALQYPPHREDEIQFSAVWAILRRHWKLILAFLVLALGAAALITASSTPVYEASTSIRVEERETTLPEVSRRLAVSLGRTLATEIAVLKSRALAEDVVDSLALRFRVSKATRAPRSRLFTEIKVAPDAEPTSFRLRRRPDGRFDVTHRGTGASIAVVAPGERVRLEGVTFVLTPAARRHQEISVSLRSLEDATDALRGATKVKAGSDGASIITIKHRSTDPLLSRDVLNAMAARYVMRRQHSQKAEARSTARFIRGQLDTLSAELASAENALRAFREREHVVNPAAEATAQVGRLAQLQAERNTIDAERSALARFLNDLEKGSASPGTAPPGDPSPYRRLIAFPTLLRNQAASQLLGSLTTVEDQRAALLMRRTPRDPDVQALSARVRELEEQLRAITVAYQHGLASQVASLDSVLAGYGRQLGQIPAKETGLARLQREPKVLEEMVALLQTRLKEAQIAQAVEDPSVQVLDEAVVPTEPVSPQPMRNFAAALFVGLLLGVAAALTREYLDRSVHTRNDVQLATGVPVLGLIPRIQRRKTDAVFARRVRNVPGFNTNAAIFEAYSRLQTNIAFTQPERPVKTVVFTSALPGDGKTTSATNLAFTLAHRGKRVLLIDADLRRGVIHTLFNQSREPGLSNVLLESAPLPDAIRSIPVAGSGALELLPTGSPTSWRADLLGSGRMDAMLAQVRDEYDAVILDSPPLNVVADAGLLGTTVDGVVLVARAGVTAPEALAEAMEQLRTMRVPVLGAVLNDIDLERDATYDRAYKQWGQEYEAYYAPAAE